MLCVFCGIKIANYSETPKTESGAVLKSFVGRRLFVAGFLRKFVV